MVNMGLPVSAEHTVTSEINPKIFIFRFPSENIQKFINFSQFSLSLCNFFSFEVTWDFRYHFGLTADNPNSSASGQFSIIAALILLFLSNLRREETVGILKIHLF